MESININSATKLFMVTILSYCMIACNSESISYDTIGIGTSHKEDFETPPLVNYSGSKDVTNSTNKSYTRISTKHASICPKLLQKNIDSSEIARSKEYLNGNYCDYYIYPKVGQILSVNSDSSKLSTFLIMPQSYNFDNGPYMIEENRRHIIRVSYDGIEYKPNEFTYSIKFDLKD